MYPPVSLTGNSARRNGPAPGICHHHGGLGVAMAKPGTFGAFLGLAVEDRLRKPEADLPVVGINCTPAHLASLADHPVIVLHADRECAVMPRWDTSGSLASLRRHMATSAGSSCVEPRASFSGPRRRAAVADRQGQCGASVRPLMVRALHALDSHATDGDANASSQTRLLRRRWWRPRPRRSSRRSPGEWLPVPSCPRRSAQPAL